ncbi:MAG: aminomethyl-transferring glycine dehydrogenase subunit GcvPA [Candidatus Izemoplasmatales bacterium]|nr:aminomethyl-transferring glycine dehydrogenase subunit GcvPA [Candidatus Izemoplasmatales bacterium]
MFRYFPHTAHDLDLMQHTIGIPNLDALFQDVPKDVLFQRDYHIPEAMSEIELRRYFEALANENTPYVCFAGLGVYDHYQPSVIPALISRQEFLTSYTPYQPEVSQGTLQYIFEYQSMIQTLTGMDVANASMYDGATATAEAAFMAEAITRRKKILISQTTHPHTIEVVKTYAHYHGLAIEIIPQKEGETDHHQLQQALNADVAAFIIQKPNFFGIIEDVRTCEALVHEAGALLIENADISALGVLKSPKEDGADIAVGDCQALGIPMAFGGPTLGYMATQKAYVRKMPGRICGMSQDLDGKRAFVLTLQAREQHIRREKANSNICSNQSLMALYVTIYLALMGPKGLRRVNELSYQGAHDLADKLASTGKFRLRFDKPFLKEFVMESMVPRALIQEVLTRNQIFGAVPLEDYHEDYRNLYHFAVTEKRTQAEIDRLVQLLGGLSW